MTNDGGTHHTGHNNNQENSMAALDQYIAPGLRLWMLIALVSGVLLVMVVLVCCFMRIRIPRTKRQIDLIAARRKMRKQSSLPAHTHPPGLCTRKDFILTLIRLLRSESPGWLPIFAMEVKITTLNERFTDERSQTIVMNTIKKSSREDRMKQAETQPLVHKSSHTTTTV
ncbi:unnamed protein product [Anisakis simplex]|uniref:Transmembrane inner ear n=1 Tax=Anisakis simplex TaxID=6269 RepID=A0A0M3K8Z1_ANISI|nr:unnamed protein product [Anisakis simplex]